MKRLGRPILATLLAVVFGSVLLEAGARFLERARGTPWDPAEQRDEIERALVTLSRREEIHGGHVDPTRIGKQENPTFLQPYFGYERLRSRIRKARDLEEYRSPDSERSFDVCVLGGSVAQNFGVLGAERLTEKLSRDPRLAGREIRIRNSALPAYKQLQLANLLVYLLALGHRPDAVIELDGFNEAALGWANMRGGAHPLYPYLPLWANAASGYVSDPEHQEDLYQLRATQNRARAFGERLLAGGASRSAFLGRVGRLWFDGLRRDHARAFERYLESLEARRGDLGVKGPSFSDDESSVARQIAAGWEQASISMHGMCAERGIVYLHVIQPTLCDPGSKPATEKELAQAIAEPSWVEGVERIYPLLREAGRRLSARGVSLFDASGVFRDHPEDVYDDVCHFGEHGHEILADAVADALIAALPD